MITLAEGRNFVALINDYVGVALRIRELKATQEEHDVVKRKIASVIAKMGLADPQGLVQVINEYTDKSISLTELKATYEEVDAVKRKMSAIIGNAIIPGSQYM